MIPYIVVFIFNFLLACIAEKCYERQHIVYICVMFAIVIIDTIFIGLRDFGVGIDTIVYIDEYYSVAKYTTSIHSFLQLDGYDKAYLILAKIASDISRNSQSLMVLTELLIIGFTLLGVNGYKKTLKINIPIFLTLYWLLYLCHSENLMRQYCAMSLLFWGFSMYIQGHRFMYCIVQVIAYFFHTSSLIFLIAPLFFELSQCKNLLFRRICTLGIIVLMLLSLFFYYQVLQIIGNFNVLNDVYFNRYSQGSAYEREGSFSWGIRYILQTIIPFIMFFHAYKKKVLDYNIIYLLVALYLSMVIVEQLRYFMVYMFRLAHYFGLIFIVYQTILMSNKKSSLVMNILYILILISSFYMVFMTDGNLGWNYRYSSKILGI